MIKLLLILGFFIITAAGPNSAAATSKDYVQQALRGVPKDFYPESLEPAVSLLKNGRAAEALALIEATTSKSRRPQYAERVAVLKGICYLELDQREEAIAAFNQAIILSPSSSDAHFFLAVLTLPEPDSASDKPEANDSPSQSIQAKDQDKERASLSPTKVSVEAQAEMARERELKLSSAESHLMDAVWFSRFGVVPKSMAFAEYAKVLNLVGKNSKALENAEKAAKFGADDIDFKLLLSELYTTNGKGDQAVVILRKELAKDDSLMEFKLALAKALIGGANRELHRARLQEAADLAPEAASDKCCRLKGSQALIRAHIELGKLEIAENLTLQALANYPNSPELKELQEQVAIEKAAKLAQQRKVASPTP